MMMTVHIDEGLFGQGLAQLDAANRWICASSRVYLRVATETDSQNIETRG
jgi:hypothetical protein